MSASGPSGVRQHRRDITAFHNAAGVGQAAKRHDMPTMATEYSMPIFYHNLTNRASSHSTISQSHLSSISALKKVLPPFSKVAVAVSLSEKSSSTRVVDEIGEAVPSLNAASVAAP